MFPPLLHMIIRLVLLSTNTSFTSAANTPSTPSPHRAFLTPVVLGWYGMYRTNDRLPLICQAGVSCYGLPFYNVFDFWGIDMYSVAAARMEPAKGAPSMSPPSDSPSPIPTPSLDNQVHESQPHTLLRSDNLSPPLPVFTTDPVDKSPEIDAFIFLEEVYQAELAASVSETPDEPQKKDTFGSIVVQYIKKAFSWNFGSASIKSDHSIEVNCRRRSFYSFLKVKCQPIPKTLPASESRTVDPMLALYYRLLWLEYAEFFHTLAIIPGDIYSSPNYLPLEFASFYAGYQAPTTPVPRRVLTRLGNRAAWMMYTRFFSAADVHVMPFYMPLEFASFAAGKTSIKCIDRSLVAKHDKQAIPGGGVRHLLLRASATAFEQFVTGTHLGAAFASTMAFLSSAGLRIPTIDKALLLTVFQYTASNQYERLVNVLKSSSDISVHFTLLFLIRASLASIPIENWSPSVFTLVTFAEHHAADNNIGLLPHIIPLFGFIACLRTIIFVLKALDKVRGGEFWDITFFNFNLVLVYRPPRKSRRIVSKGMRRLSSVRFSETIHVKQIEDVGYLEHEIEESEEKGSTELDNTKLSSTSLTTSDDSASTNLTIDTASIPNDVVAVDQLPSPPPSASAPSWEFPTLEEYTAAVAIEEPMLAFVSPRKAPGMRIDTSSNDHGPAQLLTPVPTPESEPDRGRPPLPKSQRLPLVRTQSVPPPPTAAPYTPIIAPVPISAPSSSILPQLSFDNELAGTHRDPEPKMTGQPVQELTTRAGTVVDKVQVEEDAGTRRSLARNQLFQVLDRAMLRLTGPPLALSSPCNTTAVENGKFAFTSTSKVESTTGDTGSNLHTRDSTPDAQLERGRSVLPKPLYPSSSLSPTPLSPRLIPLPISAPSTSVLQQQSFRRPSVDLHSCEDAEIDCFAVMRRSGQIWKGKMRAWSEEEEEVIEAECPVEDRPKSPASDLWERLRTVEQLGLARPKDGPVATSSGTESVPLDDSESSSAQISTDRLPGVCQESVDEVQEVDSPARVAEMRSQIFQTQVLPALRRRVDSPDPPSPPSTPTRFDRPDSPSPPPTPYTQPATPQSRIITIITSPTPVRSGIYGPSPRFPTQNPRLVPFSFSPPPEAPRFPLALGSPLPLVGSRPLISPYVVRPPTVEEGAVRPPPRGMGSLARRASEGRAATPVHEVFHHPGEKNAEISVSAGDDKCVDAQDGSVVEQITSEGDSVDSGIDCPAEFR